MSLMQRWVACEVDDWCGVALSAVRCRGGLRARQTTGVGRPRNGGTQQCLMQRCGFVVWWQVQALPMNLACMLLFAEAAFNRLSCMRARC